MTQKTPSPLLPPESAVHGKNLTCLLHLDEHVTQQLKFKK